MDSKKRWIQYLSFIAAISFACAAPSVHSDTGSKVVLSSAHDIRRFDGTVNAEARPMSGKTIRSLFSSFWSMLSEKVSLYERKSENLFKDIFASRETNELGSPSSFLMPPASSKMDQEDFEIQSGQINDNLVDMGKQADIWKKRATENLWLASLKKLEEDEQALSFVGSLVDKVENFLTAKIHAGEKSLFGYILKKAIIDSQGQEEGINSTARQNGLPSPNGRRIAKFILEKVQHAVVAHLLNGARESKGDAFKAFGSSLLFTLFDILMNSMKEFSDANSK